MHKLVHILKDMQHGKRLYWLSAGEGLHISLTPSSHCSPACVNSQMPVRRPSTAALMQAELSLHALRLQVHHQHQIRRHRVILGTFILQ